MLKTPVDQIRERLNNLKTAEMYLPERCKSMEDIVFEVLNEVETLQKRIDKITKVLGE